MVYGPLDSPVQKAWDLELLPYTLIGIYMGLCNPKGFVFSVFYAFLIVATQIL